MMMVVMVIMVMLMIIMGRIISSDDDADTALTATAMVSMMMLMVSMMMLMVQMITQIQVEMPGYLILLPAFFVSSHVFLSTTVLITVAITIERYQVVISITFSLTFTFPPLLLSPLKETRLLML